MQSGDAVGVEQLGRARIKMAHQDALAIFLAQREQPIARDALEDREHRNVEQPPILLFREVEAREAGRQTQQIAGAARPFAQVRQDEGSRMEKIEARQRAVEIVEGGRFAGSVTVAVLYRLN